MACSCGPSLHEEVPARHAAPVRPAHRGHILSRSQGRHGGDPGAVRQRQDRHAACTCQVGGRGSRRLHRLRRARQRDDRRSARIPRAHRPAHGREPDEAHGADCQHLGYAGCGARSEHLHRHHHRRILPRHGLCRRGHRGLDLPLGGGPARNVGPSRGDAR